MNNIFDCEDQETTLISVANLYEVKSKNISDFLRNVELEKYYESHNLRSEMSMSYTLNLLVDKEFNNIKKLPDLVYWFHFTSATPNEKFQEGILPLGKALNKIWASFLDIFSNTDHEERLIRLKQEVINGNLYDEKVSDPFHWGPYAHLVKEVAFNNEEFWAHDYLQIPEIVEDICNMYEEKYSISIKSDVIKALVPCIIKFKSTKRTDKWVIYRAIIYLYRKLNNLPFIVDANTCFDSKNETIPIKDIVKIEYIDSK